MTASHDIYPTHYEGGDMGFDIPPPNSAHLSNPETVMTRKYGTIVARTALMENGTRYDVFSGRPKDPITDLSIVSSPAWFTSIKAGHNMRTQQRFLREGVPMHFISIPRNLDREPDLTRYAADLVDIQAAIGAVDTLDPKTADLDTENVIMSGISQGAMKALGATAIAPHRGVHVIHAEAIAPCCAEETPLLPDLKDAPNLLAAEAKSAGLLLRIPLRILMMYPGTLDTDPINITNSLIAQSELRSGKAGLYAAALPHDQHGHLVYPTGDTWLGQGTKFKSILAGHQQMTTEGADVGGHLGCVVDEISDAHRDRVLSAVQTHESQRSSFGATVSRRTRPAGANLRPIYGQK